MIEVLKDGNVCNLNKLIDKYKLLLEKNKEIIIDCDDHNQHIAAYSAWMQVGGNIYIIPPHYNDESKKNIKENFLKLKYSDSIFFCTSGTTKGGIPKICVHGKKQMQYALNASTSFIEWEAKDKLLNFVPAYSIGFWQIIIPAFFEYGFDLILGNKKNIYNELDKDINCTTMVPALIDLIKKQRPNFDFSKFDKIISGSTMVTKKHTNFFFNNGGKKFINIYGSTEAGCLVLSNKYYNINDDPNIWELKTYSKDVEFKIINNELYVKGITLCENMNDFESFDGEWYNTKDIWQESDGYVNFLGRSDDFVKINAHLVNLLDIDLIAEEGNVNAGEVMSIVNHKFHYDYIELFYTDENIDLCKLKELYENKLSKYSIPSKYTHIEKIPKNHMGKKVRK